MKRSGTARRFGRWASVAAVLGGCVGLAAFDEKTICANGGETAVAVKLANDGDSAAFPLATPGEKAGERRTFTVDGVE
ncbi:MAG: hypothetical protein IKY61_08995, partial [Thermoguttaceae bacterium]|nr:hypothetical protein [Thermoguttaceae bacterium]